LKDEECGVVVSRTDFLDAARSLRASVSEQELQYYGEIQKRFCGKRES
jgi:hypothetical protein